MPDGSAQGPKGLNTDFTRRAEMFSADMDWVDEDGRARKVLYRDLSGPAPRMTAVVRYPAGTRLPRHGHPAGEEVFVLDGVLEDDDGAYPAGSYVLLPAGSGHGTASRDGCTFFVRQGQYPGDGRPRVVLDTNAMDWQPGRIEGLESKVLFKDDATDELVRLVRVAPGCMVPDHAHPHGEEAFLISGDVVDPRGTFGPGCWTRDPADSHHWARSEGGALLYVRSGGIGA